MTSAPSDTSDEAQIRALLDDRVRAIHEKDVGAVVAACAPDIVSFDALPPLQRHAADAVRTRVEVWFGWYDGPIGYEIQDLRIAPGEEVAFASFLNRVSGTMTNGTEVDMWLRTTMGLQKRNGRWTIVHEHTSVPFDAESGNASLDLTP